MGASGGVSMGRRLVGELLRIHRGRLGLTQKDAADLVHVSESCFGAYERAERIPTIDFLRDVDAALDARGALIACIEIIEKEKYPPTFLNWVRLERQARVISAYETMLIPGLLQTRRMRGRCTKRGGRRTPRRRSNGMSRLDSNGSRC